MGGGVCFQMRKGFLAWIFFFFKQNETNLASLFFAKSFGWISWDELMASATFQLRTGNEERDSCPDKLLAPAEWPHLQGMALFLPHSPYF